MKTATSHLIAAACVAGALFALVWKSPAPAGSPLGQDAMPDASQVDWIGTSYAADPVEEDPDTLPPVCLIRALIHSKGAATEAARCLFNVPSPSGAPGTSPVGFFAGEPEAECILR